MTPDSRPRVLLLVTSLDAGGAQRHVADLLARLHDRFAFALAGGNPGWLAGQARQWGVDVHPLPLATPPRPLRDLRALAGLGVLLRGSRPDLLHVHSTKAALIGRLAARRAGVPVVYTAHGWPFQSGGHGLEAVLGLAAERWLRGTAARVVAVSRRDAEVAREHRLVAPERLVLIENGIDAAAYPWHRGAYGRRLLYVGRLERGKGLERLLRVLARLRALEWELDVCGSGRLLPRLRAAVRRGSLEGRVRFAGWRDDPRPLLAAADCLLLPSDKEGLPYAALEALASGLSLIVSAVGGLADLDLRQVTRLPPGDEAALQAALGDFLERGWRDPQRRPRRDEVAALVRERFSLERMADRLAEVYRAALAG